MTSLLACRGFFVASAPAYSTPYLQYFSVLIHNVSLSLAGGGHMKSLHDPPPPPLAAHVAHSSMQCQLAAENMCVAASQLLSLIRTLRLSLLLMDTETIAIEQEAQVEQAQSDTQLALQQAAAQLQALLERQRRLE